MCMLTRAFVASIHTYIHLYAGSFTSMVIHYFISIKYIDTYIIYNVFNLLYTGNPLNYFDEVH